jgi:hypothetical protein
VLDIGGCDGDFTSKFISSLKERGHNIAEIAVLEPGKWKTEYLKAVSGLADVVEYDDNGFETYAPATERFDIVIASHSLYAVFDNYQTTEEERRQSVQKLVSLTKEGGYVFVILAAPRARSYYFKAEALKELFGYEPPDTTAATVDAVLIERGFTRVYIDNVMQMTKLLQDYKSNSPDGLMRWLSYFLRIDFSTIAPSDFNLVCGKLCNYVVKCESLSEQLRDELIKLDHPRLTDRSEVLSHKSALYFWQRRSESSRAGLLQ